MAAVELKCGGLLTILWLVRISPFSLSSNFSGQKFASYKILLWTLRLGANKTILANILHKHHKRACVSHLLSNINVTEVPVIHT